MLSAYPELFDAATHRLTEVCGPVVLASDTLPFAFTDYYADEMGPNLRRRFCAFSDPFLPERLAETKLLTNRLERDLAGPGYAVPRPVNLDPGYLTLSKLVLATTKNQAHRIYLRDGIYAEVTLSFRGKRFQALAWTYPDYRTDAYRAFFERVRADLLATTR